MIDTLMTFVLLGFLAATALTIVMLRDLFAVVMLFGIYSLISASIFLLMDAADVAFTEAAVGAGISTVLMLSTLALTGGRERATKKNKVGHLVLVMITGLALAWGTMDLPHYGDGSAPAHQHVAPRYIEESPREIGIANLVTAVLASYRGFDTLGEVVVVFTAGLGVVLILGFDRSRGRSDK
jgi:multicomponent Na+:H+ antiporter subunit B